MTSKQWQQGLTPRPRPGQLHGLHVHEGGPSQSSEITHIRSSVRSIWNWNPGRLTSEFRILTLTHNNKHHLVSIFSNPYNSLDSHYYPHLQMRKLRLRKVK